MFFVGDFFAYVVFSGGVLSLFRAAWVSVVICWLCVVWFFFWGGFFFGLVDWFFVGIFFGLFLVLLFGTHVLVLWCCGFFGAGLLMFAVFGWVFLWGFVRQFVARGLGFVVRCFRCASTLVYFATWVNNM